MNPMKTIAVVVLAVALAGCASVKPTLKCSMPERKAEVHQGVFGIGVGQELPAADSLCKAGAAP